MDYRSAPGRSQSDGSVLVAAKRGSDRDTRSSRATPSCARWLDIDAVTVQNCSSFLAPPDDQTIALINVHGASLSSLNITRKASGVHREIATAGNFTQRRSRAAQVPSTASLKCGGSAKIRTRAGMVPQQVVQIGTRFPPLSPRRSSVASMFHGTSGKERPRHYIRAARPDCRARSGDRTARAGARRGLEPQDAVARGAGVDQNPEYERRTNGGRAGRLCQDKEQRA